MLQLIIIVSEYRNYCKKKNANNFIFFLLKFIKF